MAATGWVQYYAHSGNLQGNQPEITQSYWHHGPTGATQWETPADVRLANQALLTLASTPRLHLVKHMCWAVLALLNTFTTQW